MTDDEKSALDATDDLNTRLSELLERTVNVFRGEPDPDSLHSWHDVPELAQAFKDDAGQLAVTLRMVLDAYVRYVVFPNTSTKDYARARAAFEAGKALGAHDKLLRR